jgi:hypothetical protein
MTSLVFRLLDHHVITGLADEAAISDERGTMSYAQLLHESACIAAGLHHMGIEPGTYVVVDVPRGRHEALSVLALARIGALPGDSGDFRLVGLPPVLHAPDTQVAWDVLDKAGRTEPASAPDTDPDGYEELLRTAYPHIVDTLASGGTIS